jgi:hypothetical protein
MMGAIFFAGVLPINPCLRNNGTLRAIPFMNQL